ncbi:WD40/YVTN/BNR-like repeat-containing protein [Actinomadura oligospora]|uniref:WD40/YVTN/BNR-like repeat-containing protein n=1 Tax=Actinomadura oligospora TaxID=111804 RepID=UPI00047BFD1E|nr:glycosyl hydrolase [Actinomadura oligospora]
MTDHALVIGTRKGMVVARPRASDGGWDADPLLFTPSPVTAVASDPRTGRLLAALNNPFWGVSIAVSDDLGRTWTEPAREADTAPIAFPEHTGTALRDVWQLRFSPTEPDVVYAGAEPAALFRSEDGGMTFDLVEGLWNHPHRPSWKPGAGGLCLHTVLPDPTDPDTVTIAISAAGVYRSTDGGATWTARNHGITAAFLPDPPPEFGQCVHKVDLHPSRPERMFLQHHGGVYRSDDAGGSWTRIDAGLPADFGFPLVVHPHRPDTLYVLPLNADVDRTPAGHRYQVHRSDDAGATWRALDKGLPEGPCYASVLRDAMCADTLDPAGIYFGTRDGWVYASRDDGETWAEVARHLPDVLCVRAVTR